SEHATAKIALCGATFTYGLARFAPRLVQRATLAVWASMVLFVVPIALFAYAQELYRAEWLPNSARHRLDIWGYTSEQSPKAPVRGAGVSSARALNNHDESAPRAPGTKYRLTTGWHSHNGYLQAWYETGAVGALFLLGLGVLVLRSLAQGPA